MAFSTRAIIKRLAALALSLTTSVAMADGIRFEQIPEGTQFHYRGKNGMPSSVRVYTGLQNGRHEMRHYFRKASGYDAKPYRITFYDAQGRMVEMHKTGFGTRVVFAPFNCEYAVTKTCSHDRRVTELKTGKTRTAQIRNFTLKRRGRKLSIYRGDSTSGNPNVRRTLDTRNIETQRDEWVLSDKLTANLTQETSP
ncbi:MAG: hypothetical protein ABJL99_16805 [Aliishimia sp.]